MHTHVYYTVITCLLNLCDWSDLRSKLEAEGEAHKAARERAEQAERQVSMATLDLKTTREEAAHLQKEVTSLQTKVRWAIIGVLNA